MQTQKNNIAFAYSLPERLGLCVDRVGGKRALAGLIGVSESQIFRYLNGLNEMTSDKLLAVARAAKVDPGWLLSGDGDMLNGGHATDKRPAFRGELLVQITQLFEELLVEFEKPFNPRQRARAITFLYNALRHEETMRGIEYQPNKFDMLKSLNYLSELRTEEELEILTSAFKLIEYRNVNEPFTKDDLEQLKIWVNLFIRGNKGYYSSYSGQVYFERKSGGQLEAPEVAEIERVVTTSCKLLDKNTLDWLDVGCGNGRHLAHIASHYKNISLKGVELSQQGLQMCESLMKSEKIPANAVMQGDARQLPYASEQFDVVFAHLSLNCIPYLRHTRLGLEEALHEILRVLKPKGIFKATFLKGRGTAYSMFYQYMDEPILRQIAEDFGLAVVNYREEILPPAPMRLNHDGNIHITLQKK